MIFNTFSTFSQPVDFTSIHINASYTSDLGRNLSGGIHKGNFFLGQMNVCITIPTFKNAEFYFQLQNTHGSTPTANLTGDLQTFSNIESGNYTDLYMAYYRQTLGKFSAIIGIHDLNSVFYVTEYGHFFLNSSFGVQPSASMNMPVSIFPKNTLGLIASYKLSDHLLIQTSVYDGDPGILNDDPHNLKHSINFKKQGLFSASEIHYYKLLDEKTGGTYKLGFQYHSTDFVQFTDSISQKGNWGVYFIADQSIKKNIGVFTQLGWSPSSINRDTFYAGLGTTVFGLGHRVKDQLGLAISYVLLSSDFAKPLSGEGYNYEANIEFTYNFQATRHISFQPDIQYIFNPGGYSNLKNAWIQMIRMNINL